MKNGLKILVCVSFCVIFSGCNLTLGPVVETKAIIVHNGTGIEILENISVKAHLLKEENVNVFKQDIGGWIAIHPDHWQSIKNEFSKRENK